MLSGRYCRITSRRMAAQAPYPADSQGVGLIGAVPSGFPNITPREKNETPGYVFHRDSHSPVRSAAFRNQVHAHPTQTPPVHGRSQFHDCDSGTMKYSSASPVYAETSAAPRRFREFEAEQPFLQGFRRTAANHIAHVQLRHFVVGQIHDAVAAVAKQLEDFFTFFQTTTQAYADKNAGIFGIGKAVVKLVTERPPSN